MTRYWIACCLLCLGIVFFFFNPEETALFPKCPFYVLTGWQCPGCGSQRALHALLHLDIGRAFHYNALLVASLPLVAILLISEWTREQHPGFYRKIHTPAFTWICFTVVILWWIGRNL